MIKRNFNLNITYGDTTVMDQKLGSFKTYCVLANTMVIATFLSERDMLAFVAYIKEHGIGHFPERIVNHIRDLGYTNNIGTTPTGLIKPLN